jgi:hypothetical protein
LRLGHRLVCLAAAVVDRLTARAATVATVAQGAAAAVVVLG